MTRLEQMRVTLDNPDYQPDMPQVSAPYLLGYLFEVGPSLMGGFGGAPLTHVELAAWQSNTGVRLQPWEVKFIINLSRDYLVQLSKAEDKDCPAPWVYAEGDNTIAKAMAARHMRESITGLTRL